MKEVMNLKFNRKIQMKLNDLFFDEEYHQYTLGEFLKIIAIDILVLGTIVVLSYLTCL